MQVVKVISDNDCVYFERKIQELLNLGYEIKDCFCGLHKFEDSTTESSYKAILIKND